MKLTLSPDILRGAYSYLIETQPFNKWNLPEPEDVVFRVARGKSCFGWHDKKRKQRHLVVLSQGLIGTSAKLIETMAHEMIHLYLAEHKIKDTSAHGAAWQKAAKVVCSIHGFDQKSF